MSETAPAGEAPLPTAMATLLSFIAGYVDSYTFLALFGLFAAQVTGSFVIAGAEFVTHDTGIIGKLVAIVAFLAAAAATAALIGWARAAGRARLPLMLGLEALLLALFAALLLAGPPITSARDGFGIVAGVIAAMAMGAQSVLVRLLMKGIPQTNVMTGNMTQLGIATTELIVAWRRAANEPGDRDHARHFTHVRGQLVVVLSVAIGFLAGAALGALAFAGIRLAGAPVPAIIAAALALWALVRERRAQ